MLAMILSLHQWRYKMKRLCSRPEILDDFRSSVLEKNVLVIQEYNPTELLNSFFSNVSGKIVVLLYMGEYHVYDWIEEVLANAEAYYKIHGKLKNYFIILSAHEYDSEIKEKYHNYFTLIVDPLIYNYYTDKFPQLPVAQNKNITRYFLSLNNRASAVRQSLFYFFNKFSLLEKSYFSYLGDLEKTKYLSLDQIDQHIGDLNNNTPWYNKHLDFSALKKTIPYKIPGDAFHGNDWGTGQDHYYKDTFCSVITETYDDQQYPYFTEKTFKAIAFGHPFLLHSNKGTLRLLKEMGFRTFDQWWDESYDDLSHQERFESILHLILEISGWSLEKLNDTYLEMLPVLEHNQRQFFDVLPKLYQDRKSHWFDQIASAINEKEINFK